MALRRSPTLLALLALLLGGALVAPPAARAVGVWTPAPPLATPRIGQAAFSFPDGRILFYGGAIATGDPTTGELYDPTRGSQGVTRPRPDAQGQEAPALLPNGRVLLTGGRLSGGSDPNFYLSWLLIRPGSSTGGMSGAASRAGVDLRGAAAPRRGGYCQGNGNPALGPSCAILRP